MSEPEGVDALAAAERRKRMLVIINPVATKMSERLQAASSSTRCRAATTSRPADTTPRATRSSSAARRPSRATTSWSPSAATARSTRPPTASPARSTALTCLPGGSNNVVAKLLGIPTDVVDATEHLLHLADRWEPRTVDLGLVNGRYFTFAAGMGLDASVVERVDSNPRLKKRFGPFYFVECAIVTFLRKYVVHPPRLAVEVDGRTVDGVSLFVQNAENYTYFNNRAGAAGRGRALRLRLLAGVVLTRARPYDVPTVTFRALSGAARIAKHRGIDAFGAFGEAVVRSTDGRAIPIQVDGDHIDDVLEARFSVAPGALRVIA